MPWNKNKTLIVSSKKIFMAVSRIVTNFLLDTNVVIVDLFDSSGNENSSVHEPSDALGKFVEYLHQEL